MDDRSSGSGGAGGSRGGNLLMTMVAAFVAVPAVSMAQTTPGGILVPNEVVVPAKPDPRTEEARKDAELARQIEAQKRAEAERKLKEAEARLTRMEAEKAAISGARGAPGLGAGTGDQSVAAPPSDIAKQVIRVLARRVDVVISDDSMARIWRIARVRSSVEIENVSGADIWVGATAGEISIGGCVIGADGIAGIPPVVGSGMGIFSGNTVFQRDLADATVRRSKLAAIPAGGSTVASFSGDCSSEYFGKVSETDLAMSFTVDLRGTVTKISRGVPAVKVIQR